MTTEAIEALNQGRIHRLDQAFYARSRAAQQRDNAEQNDRTALEHETSAGDFAVAIKKLGGEVAYWEDPDSRAAKRKAAEDGAQ